jgi:hypothetical protein
VDKTTFRLKAQDCFNPGLEQVSIINPERVAPADTTALRLNQLFNLVTQASRAATLGFRTEPFCGKADLFARRIGGTSALSKRMIMEVLITAL